MFQSVITAALNAGADIMAIYNTADFGVETKADDSPLTRADTAAHNRILRELQTIDPDTPVLSEESAEIHWAERQHWNTYWLVDPLDGTKEFIKRNGEFTVNIALIKNGEPVWGVVYAPALDILYQGGPATRGAWKINTDSQSNTQNSESPHAAAGGGLGGTSAEDRQASLQNGQEQIRVAQPEPNRPVRIVGSRSHGSPEFEAFLAQYDNPEIKSMGSSLKICLIAEGAADIYPRLGPTSEWDTAAAHAVLLGAGGTIVDADTEQPLGYNQKESVLNPHFIARK